MRIGIVRGRRERQELGGGLDEPRGERDVDELVVHGRVHRLAGGQGLERVRGRFDVESERVARHR